MFVLLSGNCWWNFTAVFFDLHLCIHKKIFLSNYQFFRRHYCFVYWVQHLTVWLCWFQAFLRSSEWLLSRRTNAQFTRGTFGWTGNGHWLAVFEHQLMADTYVVSTRFARISVTTCLQNGSVSTVTSRSVKRAVKSGCPWIRLSARFPSVPLATTTTSVWRTVVSVWP